MERDGSLHHPKGGQSRTGEAAVFRKNTQVDPKGQPLLSGLSRPPAHRPGMRPGPGMERTGRASLRRLRALNQGVTPLPGLESARRPEKPGAGGRDSPLRRGLRAPRPTGFRRALLSPPARRRFPGIPGIARIRIEKHRFFVLKLLNLIAVRRPVFKHRPPPGSLLSDAGRAGPPPPVVSAPTI
jgi:hypothetical protein